MSKVEVNEIDKQSGSTLTLGGSGTAVTLACGATQSGFGRTGTVDWQTGSIKTTTFTAVDGQGFFADTSSGAITMNLPAGTAGSIVSVVDYTNTFQNNNLTVSPNGSQKIGGVAADFVADTEGQSLTWIYVDDTEGWKNIQDSTSNAVGSAFICATGGTVTTCGNFKIHKFTGPGTFCVATAGATPSENTVSYVVVAGGGGGGTGHGAGGGAGGFREYKGPLDTYTASPLNGNPGGTAVTVTATGFPITVGAGGIGARGPTAPSPNQASTGGSPSVFSTVTSTGGGNGASQPSSIGLNGGAGGSGGGSGSDGGTSGSAGTGNTPSVSPSQGFDGGVGDSDCAAYRGGGGGGGATAAGTTVPGSASPPGSPLTAGAGGAGATSSINGTPTTRAGGGGGGATSHPGPGGAGGGGAGTLNLPTGGTPTATAGTVNTGGGGGGGGGSGSQIGGAGGSGIVIIRYKFQ